MFHDTKQIFIFIYNFYYLYDKKYILLFNLTSLTVYNLLVYNMFNKKN